MLIVSLALQSKNQSILK